MNEGLEKEGVGCRVPMIRRVTMSRFKRFESEVFEPKPFTMLVGPNNHGKTTLLQALSAWQLAYQAWRSAREVLPGPLARTGRSSESGQG